MEWNFLGWLSLWMKWWVMGRSPSAPRHFVSSINQLIPLQPFCFHLFFIKEKTSASLKFPYFYLTFYETLLNLMKSNKQIHFKILLSFVLAPLLSSLVGGGCAWGPHQKKSKESVCSGANKPQQKKREVGRACLCWGLWGGAHLPRLNFIPSIKLN